MKWPRGAVAAALAAIAALVLIAVALNSSGHPSLSAPALRRDATRVCTIGRKRTDRIALPRATTGGAAFLTRGLAALAPELVDLQLLNPPPPAAPTYSRALDALSQEVAAMRSTLHQLRTGGDPITAFRVLQQRLGPLESRADNAWRTLGIDACIGR